MTDLEAARRRLMEDLLSEHVERFVATKPPLTDEQIERLAVLLQPTPPPQERVKVSALPPTPRRSNRSRPERKPRKPEPILAGVYFIRSGELIKIGTSINVHERLNALRTMSPLPLELLAVAAGSHAEESDVHARFAHLRQHGEWFTAAPELLDLIASLARPVTPAARQARLAEEA